MPGTERVGPGIYGPSGGGGGGTVQRITSTTIAVTNPTGPTTDLEVPNPFTGATAATRYVGGTTSGAPVSGTFAVGDFVIDQTGLIWICTVAGSPGTWKSVGAVGSVTAGDASLTITPTTGAVVAETGTLDQIANLHPPAAAWSNNSQLIHNLAAGVATTDAANVGQIATPAPLPGAVNLQGHSYLGAQNIGIPEPMTQARYTASRIAGMLGASGDSVVSMTEASGTLTVADGPDQCGWGTVLQRLVPPSGFGLTARAAKGSGQAYTMGPQVNPPLPAVGQPTMVSCIGVNDIVLSYGSGLIPFTASLSGVGGQMTSSTNLSSSGSFAANRTGGVTGIQVGDFITGSNIRGAAQVAAIDWNITTPSTTTITFANTAQILGSTSSVSYSATFNATSGTSNFPGQGVTACVNAWTAVIARHVAGAIVRSDDAALTYGGTWTTVSQTNGNSGPSIAQTVVNGSTVTYTLPTTHPGGMLSLIGVGTNDLDSSGCSITLSGTAANATGTTTVARSGWAGFSAPIVVRVKTTAADAGKTIIITFNAGSGGTPQYQFDSINFDAPYQSPFIFVTQPPGCPGFGFQDTNPTLVAALNGAMTTVQSNFQTAPSGGFPSIGPITPNYTNIVIYDFAAALAKKSFYLGSTITTGTTTSITLIGQRTVVQGDQQAPYIGQQLSIPTANVGDRSEVALVTSVTAASNSGPGSAYPAWTVNLTRNVVTGSGNLQAVAATGSTSSLISPLYDVMWMAPDYVHPGDVGSSLIASGVLTAFLSVPNRTNLDFVAAGTQRWMQGRTQAYPRAVDGGSWQPRGTTGTLAMAANTAYALRYYASEWQVITQIGMVPTAGGSSHMYAAILQDVSYGSFPGLPITDLGLSGVSTSGRSNLATGPTGYQLIPPGWYWIVVAINSPVTVSTVRSISTRFDDAPIDAPLSVGPELGATGGIIGWSGTCQGTTGGASNDSSTITNILPTSWSAILAGTQIPRPFVIRNVQKYSFAG